MNNTHTSLETSTEIITAIEALHTGSVADKNSNAYAEWVDGFDSDSIIAHAFTLTSEDELFWGLEIITRP